jgi:hypothetical protein
MNAAAVTAAGRHRGWWIGLGVIGVLLALGTLAGVAVVHEIGQWSAWAPVHVVIDGDDAWSFDPSVLGAMDPVTIVVGVLVAFLAVVVVVPFALAVAFAAVAAGLVVGLGVPLLIAVLVAGALLSPVLLLVWAGMWLVRRAGAR